jgi:hypothetical protein
MKTEKQKWALACKINKSGVNIEKYMKAIVRANTELLHALSKYFMQLLIERI